MPNQNLVLFFMLLLLPMVDKCSYSGGGAEAHPIGRVCVYTDVDGYRATDYCHHLRAEQPADVYIGLPGIRFGGPWHGGGRYYGGGGWGGGGGGWGHQQPAPGIQFNFNSGGHRDRGGGGGQPQQQVVPQGGGGQGRHGQRP